MLTVRFHHCKRHRKPRNRSSCRYTSGTERDTGLDLEKLSDVAAHFRGVADKMKAEGTLDPKVLNVDAKTLLYQVPGGMLSNTISQLKQAGKEDKYYDVLAEVPRVRKDFGYPPLVTPTSQIVGTQAVMNVISGERYKMIPKESKALLRGSTANCPHPLTKRFAKRLSAMIRLLTAALLIC